MRFLFVDDILEMEPGRRIRAHMKLAADCDVFRDHFPGFPVVPGVLLTEMMAQAAGKCLDAEETHPGRAMLARILSARFNAWVRPDQDILIFAEISRNRPSFATADCHLKVDGKNVSVSELFFAFAPDENFAPDYRDEVLESWKARAAGGGAGIS